MQNVGEDAAKGPLARGQQGGAGVVYVEINGTVHNFRCASISGFQAVGK